VVVCLQHQTGTAYGIMTAIQNGGLALFPVIIGEISSVTDNNYSKVELFFVGLACLGFCVAIWLNIIDYRRGSVLNLYVAFRFVVCLLFVCCVLGVLGMLGVGGCVGVCVGVLCVLHVAGHTDVRASMVLRPHFDVHGADDDVDAKQPLVDPLTVATPPLNYRSNSMDMEAGEDTSRVHFAHCPEIVGSPAKH